MNEKQIRQKVIDTAQKYLGYSEESGKDDIIIKKYNKIKPKGSYTMKMTDSWCAAFASVIGQESGFGKVTPIECSCERMIELFKKQKCWVEDGTKVPEVADYIFYNWDDTVQPNNGWADHVGIVIKVSDTKITVIEGNMNNKVGLRNIKIGHGTIRGFGKPRYEEMATSKEDFQIGNVVNLTTPFHYNNSYKTAKKSACKIGQAKITDINYSGAHPYHIIGTGKGCTAYGWVNENDITKIDVGEVKIQKGDKVKVLKSVTYTGKKFKAWYKSYNVMQVSGDKVVIGVNGTVTCAIHIDNVAKL